MIEFVAVKGGVRLANPVKVEVFAKEVEVKFSTSLPGFQPSRAMWFSKRRGGSRIFEIVYISWQRQPLIVGDEDGDVIVIVIASFKGFPSLG